MTITEIIEIVANKFDVSYGEIIGSTREGYVIPARFAVCIILNRRGMSMARIGTILGKRDHTTIRHAIQRAEYMIEKDPDYRSFVNYMVNLRYPLKLCA